jgi:hypothetical protein
MMCPYAEFMYDGNYNCGLDGGSCDDPEYPCDDVRDYIDFGDDDELFEEEL